MSEAMWALALSGVVSLLLIGILWFTGTLSSKGESPPTPASLGIAVPKAFKAGEALFDTHCARCYGPSVVGTDQGSSLLWKIYAPNHHSDSSFYLAVQQGVRARHWRFGSMPAIPDVAQGELTQIIASVRWLQEQAGVR